MTEQQVTCAIGNIRSTPRMSRSEEQAAVSALFDWAGRDLNADFVMGCEIDHGRLKRIWRKTAREHGYVTFGTRKGSENTISVKRRWDSKKAGIRFVSRGIEHITPRRTVTLVDVDPFGGLTWPQIRLMSTHLVSQWQSYAKSYASKWSMRGLLANRSIKRLEKQVDRAVNAGKVAILGGDMNALTNVRFDLHQIQLVGVAAKARNNLGKMMQLVAVAPPGTKVIEVQTYTKAPVATDHPYRASKMRIVKK